MNSSEDPKTIPTSEPTIDSLSSIGITIEQLKNENTVKTRFPKYFNPLFRKQGIVNKFIIYVIENLSDFLGELNGRLIELNGRHNKLNSRHSELDSRVLQNTEHFQHLEKKISVQQLEQQDEFKELKHNSDAIISTLKSIDRTHKNNTLKIDSLESDYIKLNTRVESRNKTHEKSVHLLTKSISKQEKSLKEFGNTILKKTATEIDLAENRIREKYEEDLHNHALDLQGLSLQVDEISATQQNALKDIHLLTKSISKQEKSLKEFGNTILKKTATEIDLAETRIREKHEEILRNHALDLQGLSLQVDEISTTQQNALKDIQADELKLQGLSLQVDEISTTQQNALKDMHNYALNLQGINGYLDEISTTQQNALKDIQADELKLQGLGQQVDEISTTQQNALKDMHNYALNLQGINGYLDEIGRIQKLRTQNEKRSKDSFDPFYRAFENQYRGSRDTIIERFGEYKEYISEAASHCGLKTNNAKKPVALDIGCGRGEWLELLMNCKISACGVDTNKAFVADCKKAGYNVTLGDALEELAKKKSGSLAIVSGFHLVEHIEFGYLLQLIKECYRALAAGGILIFETPNPENLLVSTQTFYLDPTHRNPIPPNLLEFCAKYCGFGQVHRKPSSPYSEDDLIPGRGPTNTKLNELLYGPQDYAIIAYKS
jgi:SAM-dependent methyltransferase